MRAEEQVCEKTGVPVFVTAHRSGWAGVKSNLSLCSTQWHRYHRLLTDLQLQLLCRLVWGRKQLERDCQRWAVAVTVVVVVVVVVVVEGGGGHDSDYVGVAWVGRSAGNPIQQIGWWAGTATAPIYL